MYINCHFGIQLEWNSSGKELVKSALTFEVSMLLSTSCGLNQKNKIAKGT